MQWYWLNVKHTDGIHWWNDTIQRQTKGLSKLAPLLKVKWESLIAISVIYFLSVDSLKCSWRVIALWADSESNRNSIQTFYSELTLKRHEGFWRCGVIIHTTDTHVPVTTTMHTNIIKIRYTSVNLAEKCQHILGK